MFVVNLAFSDLVMMTTMGPTVTINVFMQRYWVWGAYGCKLYGFAGAVCGNTFFRHNHTRQLTDS